MLISDRARRLAPRALGALFVASGALHVIHPAVFRSLIPRWLPDPDAWIYVSGAFELACGAGLLTRRPWAGPASAALLVAVLPGNVQMALDAGSGRGGGWADSAVVAWARIPLQAPLVWAAMQSRRTVQSAGDGAP